MEALPLYLDEIFHHVVAVLLSVTFVLNFREVLDLVLGHGDDLFRRAQLKALVSIHGLEAGKGGELTHDETTIINGALGLTEKTAEEAMTPIESTFSLAVNSKLVWEAIGKILHVLECVVELVGKGALVEGDKITLETAKLLRENYLAHDAFTPVDDMINSAPSTSLFG